MGLHRLTGALVLIAAAFGAPGCTPSGGLQIDYPPVGQVRLVDGAACYGDSVVLGAYDIPPWPAALSFPCAAGGERGAGFLWVGLNGHTIGGKIYADSLACDCVNSTVFISGGGEDARLAQGHLDSVAQNMTTLDTWLRGQGVNVIWTTPPYLNGDNIGVNPVMVQIHELIESFPGSVDSGEALGNPLDPAYDVGDGAHLNAAGSIAYATELERLLAEQPPDPG